MFSSPEVLNATAEWKAYPFAIVVAYRLRDNAELAVALRQKMFRELKHGLAIVRPNAVAGTSRNEIEGVHVRHGAPLELSMLKARNQQRDIAVRKWRQLSRQPEPRTP